MTRIVDPLGRSTTATYNENSDVVTATGGGTPTNTYDADDNLASSRLPTGATSSLTHTDTAHRYYATNSTDSQGNATNYAYDAKGNLSSTRNALAAQNVSSYTYNANGTVATATDFKGNVTSYGYDVKGNLTLVDRPAPLGDMTYTYDSAGRTATATDGKGQRTTYAYDTLDRVTSISHQDGSVIAYVYDANGNLTSTTDNTGTTTSTYDVYNRLLKETLPGPKTIDYTYDNVGNLLFLTEAGGKVDYVYDAANQLTSVTDPQGKQTTFTYDVDRMRTSTNYPNGVSIYFTYDTANRTTRVLSKKVASGAVLADFVYSYVDPATGLDTGLRQTVTDKDGNKTTHSYDAVNRLTVAEERSSAGSLLNRYSYAYDGNSNRTSQTVNGVTTSYAHNAADQLVSAGGVTYSYDGDGNETGNSSGRAFSYNAKKQLASATPAGGAAVPMTYMGVGQFTRVSAGSTTYQTSALGLTTESSTRYTRDSSGGLISQRAASGTSYYLFDGLNSVAAVTDASGNVVASYAYEPFGKVRTSTGTLVNPYRFLGGLGVFFDPATGLHKMGTRYFDATLGRFTQTDPVDGGSANAYDYAFQNPVNLVDPSGEAGCTWLPDSSWGSFDFKKACDKHDTCYGTWGMTRKQCDDLWKREALKDCAGRWFLLRKRCNAQAEIWYQNLRHGPVASIAIGKYRSGQFNTCPFRSRQRCKRLIDRRD